MTGVRQWDLVQFDHDISNREDTTRRPDSPIGLAHTGHRQQLGGRRQRQRSRTGIVCVVDQQVARCLVLIDPGLGLSI